MNQGWEKNLQQTQFKTLYLPALKSLHEKWLSDPMEPTLVILQQSDRTISQADVKSWKGYVSIPQASLSGMVQSRYRIETDLVFEDISYSNLNRHLGGADLLNVYILRKSDLHLTGEVAKSIKECIQDGSCTSVEFGNIVNRLCKCFQKFTVRNVDKDWTLAESPLDCTRIKNHARIPGVEYSYSFDCGMVEILVFDRNM